MRLVLDAAVDRSMDPWGWMRYAAPKRGGLVRDFFSDIVRTDSFLFYICFHFYSSNASKYRAFFIGDFFFRRNFHNFQFFFLTHFA